MQFSEILAIADDASFVHPEGKKVAAKVHTAVGKIAQSGNPMVVATFIITGGPHAGKGQPIRNNFVLHTDFARQQLGNLGITYADYAQYEALEAAEKMAAAIVGKPCLVDVGTEVYNDKKRNKVGWVNPAGATPKQPAKPPVAEKSELEKLREQLAAAENATAPVKSDAPDLPF